MTLPQTRASTAQLINKKQPLTAFDVQVDSDRATTYPMVFARLRVKYIVTGHDVDRAGVEYAVQQSSKKHCGAEAMPGEVATVEHSIEIRPA